MGALDGIVFHQFLQWHHVVDHRRSIQSTSHIITSLFICENI
ncbi:DUF2243 domain-containing protein [Paenibacillus sp. S3N08]|uniref:DUF2243 domain-containing protein n=1 Tax=Paenibacillus agricola TaxID=2716264 RepID=A0ABX0JF90_9BACL|nr:DUF2243 domain-containing protein [Paenibacillus agricola]